jgi:cell fate (sporulation/competence/biofilm development) regulator YmcA (YheA/YmcA/DUF963 family)
MEFSKKAIAAGIGLFVLGGASVYLLINSQQGTAPKASANHQQSAMHEAIAQIEQKAPLSEASNSAYNSSIDATPEMTHAAFLAQADARREQNMEDKAETERVEKLRKMKLNSVECKFWKQQQERQTSSTAAKINSKIDEHCIISQDRTNAASATSENTTSSMSAG